MYTNTVNKLAALTLALIAFASCNDRPEAVLHSHTMEVYPNPVFHEINVQVQNASGRPFHLMVFNPEGEILLERTESTEDARYDVGISGEPRGAYQVVLEIDGATLTQKVVKL